MPVIDPTADLASLAADRIRRALRVQRALMNGAIIEGDPGRAQIHERYCTLLERELRAARQRAGERTNA